ncbi:MAG: hypothetical protein FWD16_02185 [Clostridia bacterium]|nr:hypothetical protein [Clostridia bacterium]
MDSMRKKAAYLKGLAEGLDISDSPEAGLLIALIEAYEEMAEAIDELDERADDLDEGLDEAFEALDDIEDVVFGGAQPVPEDPPGETRIDIMCPHCKRAVQTLYDTLRDVKAPCPHCGKTLYDKLP